MLYFSSMDYELAVVIDGEASSAKKKAVREGVEKMVKLYKGKVKKVHDWGKKELAYKIKKKSTGNYMIFDLELGSSAASELNERLRLEEGILRHLIVKN